MKSLPLFNINTATPRAKKWLLFAGISVVVLLGIFMVYAILVTPSKQPYRDALAEYKNVYNANVAVMVAGTSLNASTATDQQFAKSTEAVKTALTALKTENEALGKKTVLTSGEGKAQYDVFTNKLTAYLAFNTDMLTSMQKVRPVIFACSQNMANISENTAGVAAMQACSTSLIALESVPNNDYQALVQTSQKLYADFAINLQAKANLKDANGADSAQAKILSDEQDKILEELNTASKTFSTDLQAHKQTVDITDAAMALDRYLSDKSNIF